MTNGRTFFDLIKSSRERTHHLQEIRVAVRSGAQGKTRDEARELLVDEFRSHGLDVPSQPWLDARLDGILAPDGPMDRAKMTVEAVTALGDMGRKMYKIFRDHTADDSVDHESDAPWGFFPADTHRSVEVELDDDAQEWVGDFNDASSFRFRDVGSMHLNLHLSEDGSVVALVGDRRVGVLKDIDVEAFRPCFLAFGKRIHTLPSRGSRYRTPDGRWHVYVNPPDETFVRLLGLDIQPGEDLPFEAMRQLIEDPLPPTPSGQLHYDRKRRQWVDGPDAG